jgi:hypothetical protein
VCQPDHRLDSHAFFAGSRSPTARSWLRLGEAGMDSLPDYETRAAEADRLAEAAKTVALAQEWRDIAKGYRLLAGLAAARPEADPTDGAPIGFSA